MEAVYRNRLRNVEFGSNLSTESNQLTYWIDSQTPDVSSSFHHSSADSNSNSNSSLVSKTAGTKEHTDSGYTLSSEFQRTEGNLVAETSGRYQPQSKFSRVPMSGLLSISKALNCERKREIVLKVVGVMMRVST